MSIITVLWQIIGPFKEILLAIFGVGIGLLTAYYKGKKEKQNEMELEEYRRAYNAERERDKVDGGVNNSDELDLERLRHKWTSNE